MTDMTFTAEDFDALANGAGIAGHQEYCRALHQAAAMARELEAVMKDAKRYRWLRDFNEHVCLTFSRETAETDCYFGVELDAAIDAALEN